MAMFTYTIKTIHHICNIHHLSNKDNTSLMQLKHYTYAIQIIYTYAMKTMMCLQSALCNFTVSGRMNFREVASIRCQITNTIHSQTKQTKDKVNKRKTRHTPGVQSVSREQYRQYASPSVDPYCPLSHGHHRDCPDLERNKTHEEPCQQIVSLSINYKLIL